MSLQLVGVYACESSHRRGALLATGKDGRGPTESLLWWPLGTCVKGEEQMAECSWDSSVVLPSSAVSCAYTALG